MVKVVYQKWFTKFSKSSYITTSLTNLLRLPEGQSFRNPLYLREKVSSQISTFESVNRSLRRTSVYLLFIHLCTETYHCCNSFSLTEINTKTNKRVNENSWCYSKQYILSTPKLIFHKLYPCSETYRSKLYTVRSVGTWLEQYKCKVGYMRDSQ